MSHNNQALKELTKKMNKIGANQVFNDKHLIEDWIQLSGEALSKFHLITLGLKYYSFLEREEDQEESAHEHDDHHHDHHHHEDENEHDHHHDHHHHEDENEHDHHHDHHHHAGHKITLESGELNLLVYRLKEIVTGLKNSGMLPTMSELTQIRDELEQQAKVLTAYGDMISLLENVYYKNRYSSETLLAMDSDEAFSKRVVEQLMAIEDTNEIREHLRYIYPELPMRMHKNKFFGFVDAYFEKLAGIAEHSVNNHLEILTESFYPEGVEGYGALFGEIADRLESYKVIMSEDEESAMDEAYHEMYHLTEAKNELLEKALDTAEIINHLMGIVLSTDDLQEDETYHVVKRLLELNHEEMDLVEVFDYVEENYEPLGEALMEVSFSLDKLMEAGNSDDENIQMHMLRKLEYAFLLTKEGYFIQRPESLDLTPIDRHGLMFKKQELIERMEEVFNSDSREIRRGRMSVMMGIFQMNHSNAQEIYDHIHYSIASCSNVGEKVMCMQNIYSYMNQLID